MTMTSVCTRNKVVLPQILADACRNRFLSQVEMKESDDFSIGEIVLGVQFELTNPHHRLIHMLHLFFRNVHT